MDIYKLSLTIYSELYKLLNKSEDFQPYIFWERELLMLIQDVKEFSSILNGRFINGVKSCKDLFYEDVEVYPSLAYILFEDKLHKVEVFNDVNICKLSFGDIVNNHFVVNDVVLTNGEDVPLKFFVHPYFWKRFNNDSPEYGLNFISDDMRNRIIDNFDLCVYGTVFID